MNFCDVTLAGPEENLACDEVLLDRCEAGELEALLRFWEPTQHFVVVGYANQVSVEVNQDYCRRQSIPILRRCSGGGTVFQAPGILNYSLVLRIADSPALAGIAGTNDFVMERHRRALQKLLVATVEKQGHTDLAIGGLKFSGNAQRRRKEFLLFHGSFLLNTDIGLIEKVLPLPSRQPDYRAGRTHVHFLMNLKIAAPVLKAALVEAWQAVIPLTEIPLDQIRQLARQKYRSDGWNLKF